MHKRDDRGQRSGAAGVVREVATVVDRAAPPASSVTGSEEMSVRTPAPDSTASTTPSGAFGTAIAVRKSLFRP